MTKELKMTTEELEMEVQSLKRQTLLRNGVAKKEHGQYHSNEHNSFCESEISDLQSLWIDDFETDFNNYKLETYHKVITKFSSNP